MIFLLRVVLVGAAFVATLAGLYALLLAVTVQETAFQQTAGAAIATACFAFAGVCVLTATLALADEEARKR